jgi:hypothetical protein
LNADKGGLLRISSKTEDLIYLRKSRLFRVNPRSIAVAFSKPENLNGTQIKSDAAHTLISADQAKPGV